MGTRHRQAVINKTGKLKIQQYGQWDGYPSGQGVNILEYLRCGDLEKYQEELDKISVITEDQIKEVKKDLKWEENYPYLSRDCGCKIHQMIENGDVRFVAHIDEDEARMDCEGFYTIDLQKGLFITEYYSHRVELKLNDLPTKEEYVKMFTNVRYS